MYNNSVAGGVWGRMGSMYNNGVAGRDVGESEQYVQQRGGRGRVGESGQYVQQQWGWCCSCKEWACPHIKLSKLAFIVRWT